MKLYAMHSVNNFEGAAYLLHLNWRLLLIIDTTCILNCNLMQWLKTAEISRSFIQVRVCVCAFAFEVLIYRQKYINQN